MNEQLIDRRVQAWLDDGPTRVPEGSFDTIMGRIGDAPAQERPPVRVLGRPMDVRWLAAAALLVAVTGTLIVFREPIADVVAPPPVPTGLLSDRPDLVGLLDVRGGPATTPQVTTLDTVPGDHGLVIAAACTGGGAVTVQLVPTFDVGQGEPAPDPYVQLPVPCDGTRHMTTYATAETSVGPFELRVAAEAGTTWEVAAGEPRNPPSQPAFPAIDPGEGRLLLIDGFTMFNSGPVERTPGIAFDPRGATSVVLIVQCLGEPVTVWAQTGRPGEDERIGSPVGTVDCADAARSTEIPVDVLGPGSARAVADNGFTWVRIAAAADTQGAAVARPSAPPLPDGIGETWYAEADGDHIAFGQLGSNEQAIVRVDGGWTSNTAGDLVVVSQPDPAGGTRLRLWSASRAEPIADLVTLPGADRVPAWLDGTHRRVVYLARTGLGAVEIRLVGLDGSDDHVLSTTASGGLNDVQGVLAVDDSVFVLHWCPIVGDCGRTIVDLATGEAATLPFGRESLCAGLGVADGHVVGMPLCDGQLSVERLDGSGRVAVGVAPSMAMMVPGTDGPRLAVLDYGETESVLWSYAPDGSDRREVARFTHEPFANPYLSPVRLAAPDWVLMAGALSDAPTEVNDSPTPELVNLRTGERILLPNLPGPE